MTSATSPAAVTTPDLEHSEILTPPIYPCWEPSSEACRAGSVCTPEGNTRSIPAVGSNSLRAQSLRGCARLEILPSIARRFQLDPSHQRDWRLADGYRQRPDRASCAICPEQAPPPLSNRCPKDRVAGLFLVRHIAIPTHAASAFPPKQHKLARLRGKPKSRACCPSLRGSFRSTSPGGS